MLMILQRNFAKIEMAKSKKATATVRTAASPLHCCFRATSGHHSLRVAPCCANTSLELPAASATALLATATPTPLLLALAGLGGVGGNLFRDRQMHRQVQERIRLAAFDGIIARHGFLRVPQLVVVFGMLLDPVGGLRIRRPGG